MPSPFPYSPVIREWLRKKTEIETKTLGNQTPIGSKHMFYVKEIFSAFSFQVAFLLKMTPLQLLSCEFSEIFQNTFYTENLWVTASKIFIIVKYIEEFF